MSSCYSVPHYGVTIGLTPYSHPVLSQYHSQDKYGQYVYGYATPTSSKSETRSADGVTHGGYSYIDSYGHLQTVHYTADPVHGFRVAATNLPVDLPEVAYAKAKHIAQYETIKAEHEALGHEHQTLVAQGLGSQHRVHYSNPIAVPYASVPNIALVPTPVQELPEVVKARAEHFAAVEATKLRDAQIAVEHAAIAAKNAASLSPIPTHGVVVPVKAAALVPSIAVTYASKSAHHSYVPAILYSSQYQNQDIFGQYSYGYTGPLSSKSETRTADGVTRGGYSYIDANGILQTVHYVSDPVNGFRVAATNLPIGPSTHAI